MLQERPHHLDLGERTEKAALEHYLASGLKLVVQNYRLKCGELDLVLEDPHSRELVVVEVRARTPGRAWETAAESLTRAKLRRIRNAARIFLLDYRGGMGALRFDLAEWNGSLRIHRNFWWY